MSMAIEPVRMRIEHTEAAAQKDRLIIELATECGAEADNEDMVLVMHEHGREFRDAVMPTIREAFNRAETLLEQGGWAIYNPVRLELEFCARRNLLPEELEADEGLLAELMEWELGFAAAADYIYLLKGWQNSEGAKKELETALRHGAKILLEGSALFPEALEGLPGNWAGIGRGLAGHDIYRRGRQGHFLRISLGRYSNRAQGAWRVPKEPIHPVYRRARHSYGGWQMKIDLKEGVRWSEDGAEPFDHESGCENITRDAIPPAGRAGLHSSAEYGAKAPSCKGPNTGHEPRCGFAAGAAGSAASQTAAPFPAGFRDWPGVGRAQPGHQDRPSG